MVSRNNDGFLKDNIHLFSKMLVIEIARRAYTVGGGVSRNNDGFLKDNIHLFSKMLVIEIARRPFISIEYGFQEIILVDR
ncbi:MAG: hypothetical protein M0P54_10725 [Bacteroidales bacterium]|jgi:hypothetical protein|nr:hypothetical protein [Bacteroidales bacterium]